MVMLQFTLTNSSLNICLCRGQLNYKDVSQSSKFIEQLCKGISFSNFLISFLFPKDEEGSLQETRAANTLLENRVPYKLFERICHTENAGSTSALTFRTTWFR